MPVQVYEDVWEVESELLETIPLDVADPHDHLYPRLKLRKTGNSGRVTLQTVVLENRFLKVTIVPDLGGRIIQVHDKRTNFDLWPKIERLTLVDRKVGNPWLQEGLQFSFGSVANNTIGPAHFSVHDPADESSSAGVMVSGILVEEIDWHVSYSISPESAEVLIEVRCHNRTLEAKMATCGVLIDAPGYACGSTENSLFGFNAKTGGGFGLSWRDGVVERVKHSKFRQARLWFSPFEHSYYGPRQTRFWKIRLGLFSGMPSLQMYGRGMALAVNAEHVLLQSTAERLGRKVFVRLVDDSTLEAVADLRPTENFEAAFAGEVLGVVVRDQEKEDELRFDSTDATTLARESIVRPLVSLSSRLLYRSFQQFYKLDKQDPEPASLEAAFVQALANGTELPAPGFGLEAASATAQAMRHARTKSWNQCLESIEQALNYNAEDQLAWWLKAVAERHANIEGEERTSILNARFLAPLDPVLRAEAFLSTPIGEAPGPSPLVKPLAYDPDALLDVLSLMIECGLHQDAARLIDECQRHRDTPLVRYVYAWLLLTTTKLGAEAAEQLRVAGQSPLGPPFPHRLCEVRAVRELAARFPEDLRLQELGKLTAAFVTRFD